MKINLTLVIIFTCNWIIYCKDNIEFEKITVHLVPHSHSDVGWLKTDDQYYAGSPKDAFLFTDFFRDNIDFFKKFVRP